MSDQPSPAPGAELAGPGKYAMQSTARSSAMSRGRGILPMTGAVPPEVDVVMVRHIHGDGQLRAYELGEVREYVAEGQVVAAPEPEAEAEAELEP